MRKRAHPWILALALGALACGDESETADADVGDSPDDPNPVLNPDTDPPGLGNPVLVTAFADVANDDAEVGGRVWLYADAGPAEGAASTDAPMNPEEMMDTGPAHDPGSVLETPGVESPMAGRGGGFRLVVALDGLPPGPHAWHIHSGPCGQQAPVVVPFTATAQSQGIAHPLTADPAGSARAEVTVPASQMTLERLASGRYSIHVHRSAGTDHGPTVACANLT